MNRARIRVLALVATVLSFALIAPGSAGAQEHSASRKLVPSANAFFATFAALS